MTEIQKKLFELQDLKYKEFQCRLMPTVASDTVIGVRTPALRKLAEDFAGSQEADDFLNALPHKYYEENNVHSVIIEQCKDFSRTIELMDEFLPYINNWATCDMCSPKIFARYRQELLPHIKRWMEAKETYTIRFGMGMLMRFFLDDAFEPEYLEMVAVIRSEEYYVNMMIAWFFATALAKQYEASLPYIENHRLDKWTHNKAIQKAVESYRIKPEQKAYLRTLK